MFEAGQLTDVMSPVGTATVDTEVVTALLIEDGRLVVVLPVV